MTVKNNNKSLNVWANGGLSSDDGPINISTDAPETDNYLGKQWHPNDAYSGALEGKISEIVVLDNVISDNQIIGLQFYLSSKWNLTSTVDSDGDGLMDGNDPEPTLKRETTIVAV